jgi:aminoglycoside phosphotransferase (APT) family kinase protein
LVVRLSEGRDAIQAYVSEHVSRGLAHVLELVIEDHNLILRLIGDLTEDEAMTVTAADEWRVFDAMKHLSASLDRSRARVETMSAGRPFESPPFTGGQGSMGSAEYASFSDLRRAYIDGMVDVLAVLRRADPKRGLELTAEHATFGPFNWLGWALYSHHVHTHDHIGQIEKIKQALRGA